MCCARTGTTSASCAPSKTGFCDTNWPAFPGSPRWPASAVCAAVPNHRRPQQLRAYNNSISTIRNAVKRSNSDVGGRLLEVAEKEFMIRGLGYIESLEDIRQVALGVDPNGTPILLERRGPGEHRTEMRRGLAEWNGEGEVVAALSLCVTAPTPCRLSMTSKKNSTT